MPTLNTFRHDFFSLVKWGGILIGAIILIILLIKGAVAVKEKISPTPPPPPTVKFGKLPPVFYQEGIKKNFSYTLDTISGELTVLPDRSKVYKIKQPEPNILAVDRANEKISQLGFTPPAEELSETIYRWQTKEPFVKNLIINVNASAFNLSTEYITNGGIISGRNVPGKIEATAVAENFLNILSLFPEDIDRTKTKTELLNIRNGAIIDATSISNTKLVTVHLFQKDRDGLPMVYPTGKGSTMNFTIGSGEFSKEVIDARFFHQEITDESATYPILTAEETFDRLKKNKGFIVYHPKSKNLNVVIKKIYLAYYSAGTAQKYLMPVVVFEGDNFVGYVSAITDEWIDN